MSDWEPDGTEEAVEFGDDDGENDAIAEGEEDDVLD